MLNFCTLFDSNFLLQGLAMYRSLVAEGGDNVHCYIFAGDQATIKVLGSLHLTQATIINLDNVENNALRAVKNQRTRREYYWTLTPSITLYAIEHFGLEECTYIDADLLFFESPKILLEEMGSDSVLIVEHRTSPENGKGYKLGKYCVEFNTFKNNPDGLEALTWWRDRCIEWCYARLEDGKFGDQKYLDDWPQRFSGVHELRHPGGGIAPWNVEKYEFSAQQRTITGRDIQTGDSFPLIFYHFHHTNIYRVFGTIRTKSYYSINMYRPARFIYRHYEEALEQARREILAAAPFFNPLFSPTSEYFKETLRELTPKSIKRLFKSRA